MPDQGAAGAMMTLIDRHKVKLWGVVLVVLMAAYFFQYCSIPLSHDEQHYISAGVLVKDQALYTEVPYFQTPYLPFCYQTVFALSGAGGYWLKARILNFCFLVFAAFFLYLVLLRFSKDKGLAALLLLIFLLTGVLWSSTGFADNNVPSMAVFLGGMYFLVCSVQGERPLLNAFLSGLLLTVAAGMKLYYVIFALPLAFFLIHQTKSLKLVLVWLAGAVCGAMPSLILMFFWPQEFIFNNWTYHKLTKLWWVRQDSLEMVVWKTSLHFMKRTFLFKYSNLGISGLAFLGLVLASGAFLRRGKGLLIWLLGMFGAALVSLMMLRPLYIQHTLLLLIVVVFVPAVVWPLLTQRQRHFFKMTVWVVCFLSILSGGKRILLFLIKEAPPPIVEVSRVNVHLKGIDGKAATLAPLYALEAGLDVYPSMATGVFLYRLLKAERRGEVWQNDPPAVIITGIEGAMFDGPFDAYALRNGYRKIEDRSIRMNIYVRGL